MGDIVEGVGNSIQVEKPGYVPDLRLCEYPRVYNS